MRREHQVLSLGTDPLPQYKLQQPSMPRCTILHYSSLKAIWDWIILFLVIYTAVVTPFYVAFMMNDERAESADGRKKSRISRLDDPLTFVEFAVDLMFFIDIFINFRTTYINSNNEIISDQCKIALHYVKGWFLIDLLAAIPFDLLLLSTSIADLQTPELMSLLKTARLLRLVRVCRKLDRYSEYGGAILVLLMATFALISHWLACIWYTIGYIERPHLRYEISWLDELSKQVRQPYVNGTGGPDVATKYVTALYFTLSSITSVGFGNISPTTNAEKIFSICVMLLGALMYATIFGNVTAIIQRLYSNTAKYHRQMERLREFVKFQQIPSPLQHKLEEYVEQTWSYMNAFDMAGVLRSFPDSLQGDICLHIHRDLFSAFPFKDASEGCQRSLSKRFQIVHIPPGETLIHSGEIIQNLYFLAKGTMEIVQNDMLIHRLSKGDLFGVSHTDSDGMPLTCAYTVISVTYCYLHYIALRDIDYICTVYPSFHEKMHQLTLEKNLKQDSSAKKTKCDYRNHNNVANSIKSRSNTMASDAANTANSDSDSSDSTPHLRTPLLKPNEPLVDGLYPPSDIMLKTISMGGQDVSSFSFEEGVKNDGRVAPPINGAETTTDIAIETQGAGGSTAKETTPSTSSSDPIREQISLINHKLDSLENRILDEVSSIRSMIGRHGK